MPSAVSGLRPFFEVGCFFEVANCFCLRLGACFFEVGARVIFEVGCFF